MVQSIDNQRSVKQKIKLELDFFNGKKYEKKLEICCVTIAGMEHSLVMNALAARKVMNYGKC